MRDYTKISPAVWHSDRFNNLPSDDGRYLYLYLLTNEHQTSAGCYRLPDGYACEDLRWQAERYRAARAELVEADLIQFDASTHVVRICRWFKHNPPMNEDHFTGIVRLLERLPSELLAAQAQDALKESWAAIGAQREQKAAARGKAASGLPSGSDGQATSRLQTSYMTGTR
jgi:hypothetical protein